MEGEGGGEYMGSQRVIFGLLGIAVVGFLGFMILRNSASQNQIQKTAVTAPQTPEVNDAQENQEVTSQALTERYLSYSGENLAKATEKGRAVIFFAASWCPMCQEAEKDFKAHFDKVPSDVTILKTDYDTATELKARYHITMQDTFVQVDKEGNEITKWNSGGEGIKTLLANLK
jgi:thiol:disulfide interchange protein